MNQGRLFFSAAIVVWFCCLPQFFSADAQTVGTCEPSVGDAYLDIANVRARIPNNGELFWRNQRNAFGETSVYQVPKGGSAHSIFASGIWIAGLVDGKIRSAATRYGPYEFWSGPVNDDGTAPVDCSVYDRVWKINRSDIDNFERDGATPDLFDWPTGLGAPTLSPLNTDGSATDSDGVDNNRNGKVDEPGEMRSITEEVLMLPLPDRMDRKIDLVAGERPDIVGDQMLWWIMNDLGNEHKSSKTLPIGMEVHGTAFAFDQNGDLGNTTFYRYKLYNKSLAPFEQAYFSIFSDPDLGNFDDDYLGSDSTLGMGIVFNSDNFDEGSNGYGDAPPAVANDFLQGPLVPSLGDEAIVWGEVIQDYRRLQMTSFMSYYGGAGIYGDPIVGADYYNLMQSKWKDGSQLTLGGAGTSRNDPPTMFFFSGDASAGEFWSEFNADGSGTPLPPADRRFGMSSGPFTMQPGDMQDIVFAIIWARGDDNLDSYVRLKIADRKIQAYFDSGLVKPNPPDAPTIAVTENDRRVQLRWFYPESSNNYQSSYKEYAPLGDPDNPYYELEGYELWEFDFKDSILPSCVEANRCRMIRVFDKVNGIRRVIADPDNDGLTTLFADGVDSGLQDSVSLTGLTNFQTYHFGVRAYGYNRMAHDPILSGVITRVDVTPSKQQTRGTTQQQADALADIGVTPNPYRGASTYETSNQADEVRFTNLPSIATIRIFSLSGTLVRTIEKNSPGVTWQSWDLRSENGRHLASGMYLIHIDVPGVGEQVVKFGLVGKR